MNINVISNLIGKGGLAIATVLLAANVQAVPIVADVNSDFSISYDGIGGDPLDSIDGLSATVRFYAFDFVNVLGNTQTRINFLFDVENTSVAPVLTSRVSTIGFNTSPNILDAAVFGIFDNAILGGNIPNQGTVEFCFRAGNGMGCAGGGGGGLSIGDTSTGNVGALLIDGIQSSIQFDTFTARYQSLSCVPGYGGNCPGSASGSGSGDIPPIQVSEPGILSLLGLGLIGIGLSRRRKKA